MDRIKMKVLGLSYSMTKTGAYALILADEEESRRMPIIIGMPEAQSIAIQLEKLQTNRPMTHDLIKDLSDHLNLSLTEVNIYHMENGIFFSELTFENLKHEEIKLDARTSDAVALALRFGCPIFAKTEIFEQVGILVHGANEKKPKSQKQAADYTVQELNRLMDEAVKNEDYEKASQFRDMLKAKTNKTN